MNELNLHSPARPLGGLIKSLCQLMMDCAAYCFEEQKHESGTILEVKTAANSGDTRDFIVLWGNMRAENWENSMQDQNRTTDFGAMGISLLLAQELTDCWYFSTTETSTGFDFHLSREPIRALDFSKTARLEISGIRCATPRNNPLARFGEKVKQVRKFENKRTDAFVSIIEFGKPQAIFAQI